MLSKPLLNPQTIASLAANGLGFSGLCSNCRPPRQIVIDMVELVARCGPDALVRVVIKRITCSKCGKPVDVQVGPAGEANRSNSPTRCR